MGRIDRDRMLIELWDRRARAPFVIDLSDDAIAYAVFEIARRREIAARLAEGGQDTPAGPQGKIL